MWGTLTHMATDKWIGRGRQLAGGLSARYGGWTQKLSGAVLDQAMFAGSNFAINVLLGRWMSPNEYGAFVVAYSWFILVQNIYDAVVVEPLAVFGSGKYASHLRRYLALALIGQAVIGLICGLLLAAGAVVTHFFDTGLMVGAMLGAAISTPFMLLRWMVRQPFYILSIPHWSALGGFIFIITTLPILAGLHQLSMLTPLSAMLALAVTSIVGTIFLVVLFLKPDWKGADRRLTARMLLVDHWEYGRWAIGSRLLGWVPGNIYYILLPLAISLSASATLRAVGILFMPMYIAITAVTGILLPAFVHHYHREGKAGLQRMMNRSSALLVGFTSVYAVTLSLLGKPLLHIIYRGQYDEFVTLTLMFSFAGFPVVAAIQTIYDTALRAMNRVSLTFWSKLIWAVATMVIGLPMMLTYGILGTNIGQIFVALIALAVTVYFYRGLPNDPPAEDLEATLEEVQMDER
jgi:O-antigen/teichoic acid export membrane protein